jgi:hypothetical protein
VVWPDSKTGGMSKPLSEEAYRLLSTAPRRDGCPYVLPSPNDPGQASDRGRVLRRLVPHPQGGRRARTSARTASATVRPRTLRTPGIPVKVGMALTAHKTVAMFMRYVHTEDEKDRCVRPPNWWRYSEDGRCGTCTTCVPEEVQVRHRHAAAGRGTDREAVEGRAGPSQDEREINDEA